MFNKKLAILGILLIMCIPNVLGATLHGKVYDYTLNIVENAIVQVDSVPEQKFVAKDGDYIFILNIGDYVITATYEDNLRNILSSRTLLS